MPQPLRLLAIVIGLTATPAGLLYSLAKKDDSAAQEAAAMASSRRRAFADRKLRWDTVIGHGSQILEILPYLEPEMNELKAISEEVRALRAEQSHHLAQARMITRKISDLGKQGDNVRGRIGASLRGRFGFSALKLIQFGFKPHPNRLKFAEEREIPSPAQATAAPQEADPQQEGDAS